MHDGAKLHAGLMLLCIAIGCNSSPVKPPSGSDPTFDKVSKEIAHDLNLVDGNTIVLEMTQTELGRPEMGPRDEAIVLTQNDTGYTLRYVFRFPRSDNRNFRKWDLWMNHEIIGDGTGAEIPAIKEYSQRPSSERVAEFRSEVLDHWSNQ